MMASIGFTFGYGDLSIVSCVVFAFLQLIRIFHDVTKYNNHEYMFSTLAFAFALCEGHDAIFSPVLRGIIHKKKAAVQYLAVALLVAGSGYMICMNAVYGIPGHIAVVGMSCVYTAVFLTVGNGAVGQHVDKKSPDITPSTSITVPRWNICMLKCFIFCVYFYAGLAKTENDWLRGDTMRQLLRSWIGPTAPTKVLEWMRYNDWPVVMMAYCGLALDLTVGFGLIAQSLYIRVFYTVIITSFHLMNHFLFIIESFPWVMIAGNVIFFDSILIDNASAYLEKLLLQNILIMGFSWFRSFLRKYVVPFVAFCLIGLHILIPLPCAIYSPFSNDLVWGSKCQYFSWRMMTRSAKTFIVSLKFENPLTKRVDVLDLQKLGFTAENSKTMSNSEDFIYHVAMKGKSTVSPHPNSNEPFAPPSVYADVWIQINGPPVQRYVAPNIDVTSLPPERHQIWGNNSWYFSRPTHFFPWVMPRINEFRTSYWSKRFVDIERYEYDRNPTGEVIFLAEIPHSEPFTLTFSEHSFIRVLYGSLHVKHVGVLDSNWCVMATGSLRIKVLGGTPALWMIHSKFKEGKQDSDIWRGGNSDTYQKFECHSDMHVIMPEAGIYSEL
jgi:hypothetical protein